jgi:hypothetical protein
MAESVEVRTPVGIGSTGRGFMIGFAIGVFVGVLGTVVYVVSHLYGI